MNKKLFWAMVLPAVLAGCSQEDLISEGIATPQAKAISGLTFTISKNGTDADTRASWGSDNKIQFEPADKVSLYWLGADGLTQNAAKNGTFSGTVTPLTDATAVKGKSNAVFRTEDGGSFTAEAVVYEGYNLLVYPANTAHVTEQDVVVSLPEVQKAEEDFAENVIYIGDSIIQIHQPAYKSTDGKYYDMYGHEATVDDANTSGYAHGVKTGVKLLSSLLKMKLVIENTNATDVKIQKVVLTANGDNATGLYSIEGNLVPGAVNTSTSTGSIAKYINPWYKTTADGAVDEIVLDCENIETVKAGTNVTMLLLPAAGTTLGTTCQPILKVYTNYGVVTVGGSVATGDAHSNCIFAANGVDYAADDDNAALQAIVKNTREYMAEMTVWDGSKADKKGTYKFNSGVSMSRVIKVDMQKASLEDVHVKNTAELNAILNAACSKVAGKYTSTSKLVVNLDFDKNGNFELTNYTGLDAFVTKFGAGALELASGNCTSTELGHATQLANINLNTTTETELKSVEGLANTVTITIPATSKIASVKNGTAANATHIVSSPVINNSTITVPAYAVITMKGNKGGTIHYTPGATITVDASLTAKADYGKIDFIADTKANLDAAAANGANYITVKNIKSGFFDGGIDVTTASHPANVGARGGITVEFDNCGNLNETISGGSNPLKAATIVLSEGTSYPELKNATVDKIVVKSTTAVLGYDKTQTTAKKIGEIEIMAGETTVNNVEAGTLTVAEGATVTLTEKAKAPTNFYVYGKAVFGGKNGKTEEKVFTLNTENKISAIDPITGNCLVTGTLELANDLAYTNVAVNESTVIKVSENVMGLGYTAKIFVTKDPQAKGTANLKFNEVTYNASKISWNGNFSDINW